MNSVNASNVQSIMDQVVGIIDTKIQYIDYQTNQIVSAIIGTDLSHGPLPNVDPDIASGFNFSHNYSDSFLTLMEEYSKTKRQLLLLRQQVCPITADFILDLISDNRFMVYTDEELEVMIKGVLLSDEHLKK